MVKFALSINTSRKYHYSGKNNTTNYSNNINEKHDTEPSLGTPTSFKKRKMLKMRRHSMKPEFSKNTSEEHYWLKKIDGKFIKRSEKYAKKGIAKVGGITFNLKLNKKLLTRRSKDEDD